MAEGFARALAPGRVEAVSAGARPSGKVNQTATELMSEIGIDISSQTSKSLLDLPEVRFDAAITMGCGDACPSLAAARRIEWNVPDPKHLPAAEFRTIRDQIRSLVAGLMSELLA
jgi:protein-tyrosine-phosphatase